MSAEDVAADAATPVGRALGIVAAETLWHPASGRWVTRYRCRGVADCGDVVPACGAEGGRDGTA